MSKDTVFIKGSVRQVTFNNGGTVFNVSINVEDLAQHKDDKGYARIVIVERREPDQYGNTHYMKVNDYKPEEKEQQAPPPRRAQVKSPNNWEDDDGAPF